MPLFPHGEMLRTDDDCDYYTGTAIPAETKSGEEIRLRRGIEDIINDFNYGKTGGLAEVIFRLKSLIVK